MSKVLQKGCGVDMNKHICKAKRISNGEWIEGYMVGDNIMLNDVYIDSQNEFGINSYYHVNPKTVCRYAEFQNANGQSIFEGDILLWECMDPSGEFLSQRNKIVFKDGCYVAVNMKSHIRGVELLKNFLDLESNEEVTIEGNIHDSEVTNE